MAEKTNHEQGASGFSCGECGKEVTENDKTCPHCGADVSEIEEEKEPASKTIPIGEEIAIRYRNAYAIANGNIAIGNALKVIGIVLAIVIILAAVSKSSNSFGSSAWIMGGLVGGVFVGISAYSIGIWITSQGQMMKATIDTAINTSPLIDNEQKKQIIQSTSITK
jgi:hypothetical protein